MLNYHIMRIFIVLQPSLPFLPAFLYLCLRLLVLPNCQFAVSIIPNKYPSVNVLHDTQLFTFIILKAGLLFYFSGDKLSILAWFISNEHPSIIILHIINSPEPRFPIPLCQWFVISFDLFMSDLLSYNQISFKRWPSLYSIFLNVIFLFHFIGN